jgi:hypothetical protein
MTQPGTAGTDDDPLDSIETKELVVNGEAIDTLVGLAFDSANASDGVLRFDGTGSTNGITDGSAKVIVGGTVYDVAGGEWVDAQGTSHSLDSWEKVVNSQFDVTITSTTGPVKPGNTLDVTADITNNGTDSDTQTVTLDIDNSVGQVDSTSVTLSGGGSTTQTLSWAVPSGQTEQDYTASVSSADDSASQTVTVGSAVPSSAIHRWKLDDVATGTATDSIGSADGTVNGVASVSGTYQGGSAGDGDGSNDYIDVGTLGSFGSNRDTDFAIAVTVDELQSTSGSTILGVNDVNDEIVGMSTGFNNSGGVQVSVRDSNSNLIRTRTSSGGHIDDNAKHRIVYNKTANNASGLNIYVDKTSLSTTAVSDDSGFSPGDFVDALYLFANHSGGTNSADFNFDGVADDVIIYNDSLSSSERADDYNIQPWS